jgi:RNA polymerase sigma-70 factor (ECF subfamily)
VSNLSEKTNPIDLTTAGRIRRKSQQLVRQAALTSSDRDDIEQDLTLELLRRLPAYNPARGQREPFIQMVLNHAASGILGKSRHRNVPRDLDDQAVDDPSERLVSLARDVEILLKELPVGLRKLAELLKSCSIAEASRELGIPRTTLNDRVRVLRERFERAGLRDYLSISSVT